jgi:hypothetical protein
MGMTMPQQMQKPPPLVFTDDVGRSSFEIAELPETSRHVAPGGEEQRLDRVLPPVCARA